jgi:NAD(P)H-hydrate epimerase
VAALFEDASGRPVPAVTEDVMREVDRVAVEETGPNLLQMMENAGRGLALAALEMLPRAPDGPVVVLAGVGGNGGGGIAAARHLANRHYDVLVAVTDEAGLGDAPAFQLQVYGGTPGGRVSAAELSGLRPVFVIDAVIGYSLRDAPRGAASAMIDWANEQEAPVLSLDLPSGVDATSGDTPGVHVRADRTLTLALPKTGLVASAAGSLLLADLGIPLATYRKAGVTLDSSPFRAEFTIPLRRVERASDSA